MSFVSSGPSAQHCVVVDSQGIAYAFGSNLKGQLGLGDLIQRNIPVVIPGLDGETVVSASCGRWHTLVATEVTNCFSFGMSCAIIL